MSQYPNPSKVSDDSSIVKILTGILEDSVEALKRIEKYISDQSIIINDLVNKVNKLESKFESNINDITKLTIPALEKNISEKFKHLEVNTLTELNNILNKIVNKLKKNYQLLTIQDTIKNIDDLTLEIKGKKPYQKSETPERPEKSKKENEPSKSETKEAAPKPQEKEIARPSPPKEGELPEKEGKEDDHLVRPSSFFSS